MKRYGNDEIVFLAAKRTAFGTFGGALKGVSATDLAVHAAKAALAQSGVAADDVDHVVFGNVQQTSLDAFYLARHVGLKAGVPQQVPALTVNRLCGSGFEAVVQGAQQILLGESDVVLVGGTENMSQAPHWVQGARWGIPLGKSEMQDSLWAGLTDTYTGMPMALTAEKLAEQHKISQDDVDAFSVRSQKLWAEAFEKGRFQDEIAPIEVKAGKSVVSFAKDEHPRPDTTVDGLKKLPKVFKKDGVIHAGAASGICDGAAALVLARRSWADKKGMKPIGRLVSWGTSGCDPTIMGIGPVPAARIALERCGAAIAEMQLVEVNEAFAPQALAVQKELGFATDVFNVDGGAIALGHPLGASGARITTHLLYALKQRSLKVGLGSACIGGGQGIAVVVEAL